MALALGISMAELEARYADDASDASGASDAPGCCSDADVRAEAEWAVGPGENAAAGNGNNDESGDEGSELDDDGDDAREARIWAEALAGAPPCLPAAPPLCPAPLA